MKTEYMEAYLIVEQYSGTTYYHDAFFDYEEAKEEVKNLEKDLPSSHIFIQDISIKNKKEK